MDSLWLQHPSLRPARRWSSWACSFSSEKRRAQCGRSAFSAFWDASWEAHLGIASWGSLGESARDSKGGWGSHQGVYGPYSCWQRSQPVVKTSQWGKSQNPIVSWGNSTKHLKELTSSLSKSWEKLKRMEHAQTHFVRPALSGQQAR